MQFYDAATYRLQDMADLRMHNEAALPASLSVERRGRRAAEHNGVPRLELSIVVFKEEKKLRGASLRSALKRNSIDNRSKALVELA